CGSPATCAAAGDRATGPRDATPVRAGPSAVAAPLGDQPMADLTERIVRSWGALSRWAVPVMMALAYALLVATSETDATGKAWMAAGVVLVLTAWFAFRALADAAALSRALSVGDTAALSEIADRAPVRRRRPAARARPLIARGFAQLLRG